MKKRLTMALAAGALATALLAPSALASPPAENMGCPEGFTWMVVGVGDADRTVPKQNDAIENGGNGDGIVCARALGDGVVHTFPGRPDIVYEWSDNKLK